MIDDTESFSQRCWVFFFDRQKVLVVQHHLLIFPPLNWVEICICELAMAHSGSYLSC